MASINVLDFSVANLIAAGEVVDRPASAVKELLENSIDAGAKHITVEIKRGGISLIRVGDDGCGISREDVPISIKRHATSKIRDASDLDGIMTLGFRGEALAAIASVSKMRIMTKSESEDVGTLLVSDCGEVIEVSDVGCRNGTTVIIEELFANVPARRKFLKRDVNEAMAVAAVVEKIALSRPDIAIRFINDGSVRFDTVGDGKLANTIYAVLGRDFAKKMIEVKGETEGIEVYGYIGSPENARGNRNYQNYFINHRYVKSGTITSAVEEAYKSYIPTERFPSCVLNLTIHPALVDVNVHPAKLEVKFSDDRIVFNSVYCAVKNSLISKIHTPELELRDTIMTGGDAAVINAFTTVSDRVSEEKEKSDIRRSIFDIEEKIESVDKSEESNKNIKEDSAPHETSAEKNQAYTRPAQVISEEKESEIPYASKASENKEESHPLDIPKLNYIFARNEETVIAEPIKEEADTSSEIPFYRILGIAFNSYIFIELEKSVMMIDKHAAHERIIFEQMKRNMNSGKKFSQLILVPVILSFGPAETDVLEFYRKDIESIGLEYDISGNTVQINAVPVQLGGDEAAVLLEELAGRLSEGNITLEAGKAAIFERSLYQASCKAAMKAGRVDSDENIKWLCDELLRLPDIKVCPHGRPVAYELTRHEIEKHFGRI